MPCAATIVWFRRDLRVADNPALARAASRGAIVPVFVWAPHESGRWPPGAASRWWLHHSLVKLDASLRRLGTGLVIRSGSSIDELRSVARATNASAVVWNRDYEPDHIARDLRVEAALREDGLETESFNARLLHEPWDIRNGSGEPYKVFTPFWRACFGEQEPARPVAPPETLSSPPGDVASLGVGDLQFLPKIDWTAGLQERWTPGEAAALERLETFVESRLADYARERDRPDIDGTSSLSPHLHFGEIGPRQIWHAVRSAETVGGVKGLERGAAKYLAEIGWREFSYHLLHHFPQTPDTPLREEFSRFPWLADRRALRAWHRGRTGFPFVDAGLRQLWATGWMHNRVRMVVASFLVKDLMIPWQKGAEWFWDTLVDADLANNTQGWQWTAGCGADAAPYFRVFNPITQGKKFDPDGSYVRRWVPELSGVSTRYIHEPWNAPEGELDGAGIRLGKQYPRPIVDHAAARRRALAAHATLR